ncbi:50S ribosome-binding GTPase [Micromonospora sp. STR1s_5]|nr:50S ribosome-binding GTPase [Micromonospora sp. STR1s_5]
MMAGIWLDVLDEIARTCTAHGRGDLLQTVRQKRAQLLDPTLRVLIIGEPNQGKSQLINAIINAPACPVGDGRTTVLPTWCGTPRPPPRRWRRRPHQRRDTPPAPPTRWPSSGPRWRSNPGRGGRGRPGRTSAGRRPAYVEIGLPRALLGAGLVLVDTPGTTRSPASAPPLRSPRRPARTPCCWSPTPLGSCRSPN